LAEEAPAPGAPGWAAPAPELLAACRHPVIVTVFAESWLELALGVLGVCDGGVEGGVVGGCWAPTPTASAALSIVPKMI
jgi:hypothetical protein